MVIIYKIIVKIFKWNLGSGCRYLWVSNHYKLVYVWIIFLHCVVNCVCLPLQSIKCSLRISNHLINNESKIKNLIHPLTWVTIRIIKWTDNFLPLMIVETAWKKLSDPWFRISGCDVCIKGMETLSVWKNVPDIF